MTRPIAPEDLFRFRFIVAADLSPDGNRVVFAQTRIAPGEKEDDDEVEHTDLHLLDVESGEVRRLTFNDSTNSAPAISPDGSTVAFLSSRTEKPQLWLLPLDGGEPRKLTDLPQGVGSGAVWSPDGSTIAFTAGPPEERKPERPYRVDRTVWRFDGMGRARRRDPGRLRPRPRRRRRRAATADRDRFMNSRRSGVPTGSRSSTSRRTTPTRTCWRRGCGASTSRARSPISPSPTASSPPTRRWATDVSPTSSTSSRTRWSVPGRRSTSSTRRPGRAPGAARTSRVTSRAASRRTTPLRGSASGSCS